jgi:hypothetical protein
MIKHEARQRRREIGEEGIEVCISGRRNTVERDLDETGKGKRR